MISCPFYAMLANLFILAEKMFYMFWNVFLRVKQVFNMLENHGIRGNNIYYVRVAWNKKGGKLEPRYSYRELDG
jgi:hypothetical protein